MAIIDESSMSIISDKSKDQQPCSEENHHYGYLDFK